MQHHDHSCLLQTHGGHPHRRGACADTAGERYSFASQLGVPLCVCEFRLWLPQDLTHCTALSARDGDTSVCACPRGAPGHVRAANPTRNLTTAFPGGVRPLPPLTMLTEPAQLGARFLVGPFRAHPGPPTLQSGGEGCSPAENCQYVVKFLVGLIARRRATCATTHAWPHARSHIRRPGSRAGPGISATTVPRCRRNARILSRAILSLQG